ncbi:7-cyano-7-deazaguanine synthase [Campylobacter gracilis]|uniref:7-cyano-7-deazaguanine synthase n=1 Tax=Campylobacter gracilis RM3268 TaxID=553220 RepID=C8PJP9_9BACT|nr:7-cyano-7-deazaguanine synthase [Campylobacter gracilis]EEV17154.1 putative protein ExsB [Campylobacter gracilis RM3268]SUW81748.1 ExsB protein [Campylobacter gracilis]
MRALCVISGGMDSATCAYIARREGYEIVALHFDYDQRTMGKERECFGKICDDLGVAKRLILDARFIAQIGGSALTDGTLPIRKGAAELCGAANTTGAEIDSAANSKSAELGELNFIETNSIAEVNGQNSIAANSTNAETGGQNFTASNFMASSADATLGADSARDSRLQSGEILIQDAEILLGGDEFSPQGSKILACDDKISSQGSKILVQEGEISSQSGAQPQQGDKISSKRAEGEIPSQSQSDKISPSSGESAFSDLPSTYVPFRNGVFLSIAAALAEKERCDAIFIGVVQEDSSGYPDCGASFIAAFERALELGTSRDFHPRIKTPLVHLSKAQIVSLALEIGVPLELTWSCYEREDAACGLCDSCLLRLKGFAGAGAKDKIPYAIEA